MPIVPVVPHEGFKYLRANLHCCEEGSSDKLWALYARDEQDHGPVVTVWGRNGGKMNVTMYKDAASVDIPKLIRSKTVKGYKPHGCVAHPHRLQCLVTPPALKAWLSKQPQNSPRKKAGSPARKKAGSPARKKAGSSCSSSQVRNPSSGRCVSRSGSIGRRVLYNVQRKSASPKRKPSSPKRIPPKASKGCASDKMVNPATRRCVSKTGKVGQTLLKANPPKGTNANNPDALLIATERLLKRLGHRSIDIKLPKSMLLTMSQVNRIKKKRLVLPVVPPQMYDHTMMLTAYSEDIAEDFFYEGLTDGVAVTSGDHVWWVVSPKLVEWIELFAIRLGL